METNKISLKEKIGFCMVNLGSIPISSLINTYLLIFYTDIVGVSPSIVGTLFFAARFVDAMGDPVMGFLTDRFPRTRYGKYNVMLMFGSVISSISFAMLWFGPLLAREHKIAVIAVTYFLFGVLFDLMDIPLNSLLAMMSAKQTERNVLSSIKGVSYSAGAMILNVFSPLLIARYAGEQGYLYTVCIAVVIIVTFSIVGASMVKERNIIENKGEKYSVRQLLQIMKIRPVLSLFLTVMLSSTALFLYQSSVIYYVKYVLQDFRFFSISNVIGVGGALIGGLLLPGIAKKHSKIRVYLIPILALISILLVQVVNYKVVLLFYVVVFFRQIGISMVTILQYSLAADNVTYVIRYMNVASAGAIASLNSLAMKFSLGISAAIQGSVLEKTGYIANARQGAWSIYGILTITFIIPVIFYLFAALIFKFGYKRIWTIIDVKEPAEVEKRKAGKKGINYYEKTGI